MRNEPSDQPTGRLDMAAASASPCATCDTSPCCTHLPLQSFTISDMRGVDHARYLLNFQRIRLGLSADGTWQAYYYHPCRYLDRDSRGCTIHGQPQQPRICVHYNPYQCWYKAALTQDVTEDFLLMDRRRFDFVVEHLEFDALLNLVGNPDWPTMLAAMAQMPIDPAFDDDVEADDVYEQWLADAAYGVASAAPAQGLSYAQLQDPCGGCAAHCCRFLIFPHPVAAHASGLDYLQFALGFPGVELGMSDGGWSLVLRTRCRHLDGDRCGVYGQPERPKICTYYDALSCDYRGQFGRARPEDFFRVRLEHLDWLVETFVFDGEGAVTALPTTASARAHVEWRWQAAVADAQAAGVEPPRAPVAPTTGLIQIEEPEPDGQA